MNAKVLTKKIVYAALCAGCIFATGASLTGCLTSDKTDSNPPPAQHTPWGAETTIKVGAQGNTLYGSAVDLDAKKALLSKDANAAQGTIDIVFYYSKGNLMVGSPVAAKAAGDVPLATSYDLTKVKDLQLARVSTKPEDSQAGDTAYAQTPKDDNSFVGELPYLVKTTQGKLASFYFSNIQGDSSDATADLTISLSGI